MSTSRATDAVTELRAPFPEARRYLRFVRSIALGALVAGAPLTGCGSSSPPVDGGRDASFPVDGPLHPPSLRRRRPRA